MGCFGGGGKPPSYQMPQLNIPSAQDLFNQGNTFFGNNQPMAYGAREGALRDLQDPSAYYSSFQPTSFEQALGNQHFQNVWPDTQAYMQNILSKSGMAYSPVAAQTLGKEYGNLSTSIGQYLSDQANQRATGSLNARMGIDPMSMLTPFAQAGANQSNTQANAQMMAANAQYQNAMSDYQYQQQKAQGMGGMAGGGIGALGSIGLAPFTGGASLAYLPMAASMGQQLGTGFAGGPMNMGNMAATMGQIGPSSDAGKMFGGFGSSMFGGGGHGGGSGVSLVNNFMGNGSSGLSSFSGAGRLGGV